MSAPSRLCLSDRMLAAIPALILVTVASVHIWRWHHERVSAWRGGGFGMYSTVNDQRGRRIHLFAMNKHQQWEKIEPPRSLSGLSRTLMLHASRQDLQTFGQAVACSAEMRQSMGRFTALKVEFRELDFDSERFTVANTLKESVVLELCS